MTNTEQLTAHEFGFMVFTGQEAENMRPLQIQTLIQNHFGGFLDECGFDMNKRIREANFGGYHLAIALCDELLEGKGITTIGYDKLRELIEYVRVEITERIEDLQASK